MIDLTPIQITSRYSRRNCTVCGVSYKPIGNPDSKYCSIPCFRTVHKKKTKECVICGTSFYPARSKLYKKYCSTLCKDKGKSEALTKAKFGKGTGKTKYLEYKGKPLHRYVMEQHLGRPLTSEEHVHHKDGNKKNNDISNLEIMTRSQHMKHHGYLRRKTFVCIAPNCGRKHRTRGLCNNHYARFHRMIRESKPFNEIIIYG